MADEMVVTVQKKERTVEHGGPNAEGYETARVWRGSALQGFKEGRRKKK